MTICLRRRDFVAALGGAAAWPVAARAQQQNSPVIGYLRWDRPEPNINGTSVKAFRAGLADGGFIEGRNLSIEYRWANGNFGLLPSLAADLVRRQVAVIVAFNSRGSPLAAKRATSTIPIVFAYGGDPVMDGLVASLSRPGSNVTGMTFFTRELFGKRLDLLLTLVPQARKVGFLSGPSYEGSSLGATNAMLAAGRALGVEIMIVECRDDRDFEAAVAKMVEGGAGAMYLGGFPFLNLDKVVSLAALHKLPAIYPYRSLTDAGGLMSYGVDGVGMSRRIGSYYVARILKGAKPADLPVEQPTKFELRINLKTAKTLGLTVPPTLFALATEVIE